MSLLTDEEIKLLGEGTSGTWQDDLQFARAIEAAVIKNLSEQSEPIEIEYPDYSYQGMGCGLEDRGITDRYEAMRYGWDCAIDAMAERIPDILYIHPEPQSECIHDIVDINYKEKYESAEKDAAKYQEWIYAVGRKFPDETRHETALKYIRQMETKGWNAAGKESEK